MKASEVACPYKQKKQAGKDRGTVLNALDEANGMNVSDTSLIQALMVITCL